MQKLIVATLAVSILCVPAVLPASALPIDGNLGTAPTAAAGEGPVQNVAFRHFGGFHRGGFGGLHRGFGRFRGGFGGRRFGRFGGRRFYGGRRFGYGVGAGVAGLAAGAIIGGAVAAAARSSHGVAYCESRFKSYNPATGTYLGYDGLRHACP